MDPEYGKRHQRIRQALLASGTWIGTSCPFCSEPMLPGQRLDLCHADDPVTGRGIPGRYVGLGHSACNQGKAGSINPWGIHDRAKRSPERQAAVDAVAARREYKAIRAEFDAVHRDD